MVEMRDDVTPPPAVGIARRRWRDGRFEDGDRMVPEELPIALTFNRTSHAVMMATPADLDDFARGFSLSEEIVGHVSEIEEIETVLLRAGDGEDGPIRGPVRGPVRGIELRLWVGEAAMGMLDGRRRHIAGPTGCGLCGLESLDAALRPPRRVPDGRAVSPASIMRAAASLRPAQALNRATHAVHAAGFWTEAEGLVAVREDVGRHNALDKLHGALAHAGRDASDGILLMTSRISVELVQKASIMRVAILVAVSAPTALAMRVAEQAGMTLVAVARDDGFEVCTGAWRVTET